MNPKIPEKDGKKEFAVLSFDEFLKIQEELQDYDDLKDLREARAKEKNITGMSLSPAKRKLDI